MTPEEYAAGFKADMQAANAGSERALQRAGGQIGASDFDCRQRTAFILSKTEPTDESDNWAALVGTALDDKMQAVRHAARPHLLFGLVLDVELTLPSGEKFSLPVRPDEVDPEEMSVTDYKSKNGLEVSRRELVKDGHRIQRHLQALGMIQNHGWSPEDVTVRNVMVDRSGADTEPHVEQEPFSWDVIHDAEAFLWDSLYSARHRERTHQDRPRWFCESFCQFFTICRGDEVNYVPIFDTSQRELIEAYYVAGVEEKRAKSLKAELRPILLGLTGVTSDKRFKVTSTSSNRDDRAVESLRVTKLKGN